MDDEEEAGTGVMQTPGKQERKKLRACLSIAEKKADERQALEKKGLLQKKVI